MDGIVWKIALRRLIKLLHTLGAAGFMGGMAALAVAVVLAPASIGTASYAPLVGVMAKIAAWIVGPSMILTVISGLLAMVVNPAFYDVAWVWLKAATGILVLEGGLHVLGPLQEEAKRGAGALAPDPGDVTRLLAGEAGTLWALLAVSVANVALGVWRPRFSRSAG